MPADLHLPTRRRLLAASAGAATGSLLLPWAPAVIGSDNTRPRLPYGLQFGDPDLDHKHHGHSKDTARTVVWTRADRPARLYVDWSYDSGFASLAGSGTLLLHPSDDGTGRVDLTGLPPGRRVHVRAVAESLDGTRTRSEPATGSFVTPAAEAADIRFVWGGDTAGQGWGISPNYGGMLTYRTMLAQDPAFFIHSGDTIYADGAIAPSQALPGGAGTWTNITTPEKSKVAETLDEFRGNYRYNLMDEHLLAFNREVAQIWQWDDHEVVNNWSDAKDLSADTRYAEKSVALLTARATQAFRDYAPMRARGDSERDRVYRRIDHGPLLELFMIDMRSYRGPNSANLQASYGRETFFLGPEQLAWLERSLRESKAVWKVICADMPIGLQVPDGRTADGTARWEAVSNGIGGVPSGRELEIAKLLSSIRHARIRNVVWLTADVHYCAAHRYLPERAAFKDFDPFWEFVSGPLHAGAFGPNQTDDTFGLEVVFQKVPRVQNEPPSDLNQFFGQVDIDARSRAMTVSLKDRAGTTVFSQVLPAS